MKRYYAKLGITDKKDSDLSKQTLHNLYKVPKRDKGLNVPHFQPVPPGVSQQADLLYLPEDNGYKYALVVVDNGSRKADAEPLKSHSSEEVTKAFKHIYSRTLKIPTSQIQVDSGAEFRGATEKFFKDNNVVMRFAKAGRHRQQALVERVNQTLGTILHKRMAAQELLTGEVSKEWVSDLPKVIEVLNDMRTENPDNPKTKKKLPGLPVAEGDSKNMLELGTKVRVMLDAPKSVHGDKLHGKFRSGDIRWDPKIRTIKNVTLKENLPPMYLLDGNVSDMKIEPIGYTKNQLQVVDEKEELPPGEKVIRGTPTTYYVEKILAKKKEKNKIYYSVKWKGFKEPTWEPRTSIFKQVPEMIKEYDKK